MSDPVQLHPRRRRPSGLLRAGAFFALLYGLACVDVDLDTERASSSDSDSDVEVAAIDPARARAVDAVFASFDRPGSVGCAVGIASAGALAYAKGYGTAHLDWDIPITPETVFYVGSVSKQLTATAVALLAEDGTVDLDASVRTYLPTLSEAYAPVTLRHLIHHTSGVRDMYTAMREAELSTWDRFTREEALGLLAETPLDFSPGEQYSYSNGGYFLLSMVIEQASGSTLREFSEERIFGPLGMEDTHFHDDPVHIVPRRAMSYQPDGEGGYVQSYQGNFALPGAGGLYTSVRDFEAWDRNFSENRLGGETHMELIHTLGVLNDGTTLDYAFAQRQGEHDGHAMWSHTGSFMGFKAYYARFPEDDLSVWVFCNMGEIVPQEFGLEVAELFLD